MGLKPMIRERRMEAHLTQVNLAEKINIRKSHLSEIESGKHYPSTALLWQIAKACNCKVDELYKYIE